MYQGEIRLSAGDSIAYMNQNSRHMIACAVSEVKWHETIKSVPDAIEWANYCEQYGLTDCYASDNTFRQWRNVTNVKEITRLAVDLDYYRSEYKHLEAVELWEEIAKQLPWMPKPTIIEASGRGAYLKWKLKRSLPINQKTKKFNFLGQWQVCQDFLVNQLKPFGADPKASDVTRVLRVSGTINSNSMTRANAWTCGPEYEFSELKSVFNEQYKQQLPPKITPKPRNGHRKLEKLFNWHSLAFARLRDIERLAEIRGGKYTEHRRRVIFIYAVELANYCRSEQSLLNELERFVSQYIENPTRYTLKGKRIHLKELLRRFKEQEQRGHWDWFMDDTTGRYSKNNRYLLKTSTIIDDLDIQEDEQRDLSTLIGSSEKYRRKVTKRRVCGVKPREEYLSKASERKTKAKALHKSGMKTRDIAKALGVTDRSVRMYLK